MELVKTPNFELAVYAAGDKASPKFALVLPGRLDTKDYAHMRSHVDFLASLGYFALSFDPPGTWESPGDIELYTTQNYLKAINELIELFGNKPTVIMGHSRGGSMALLAGINNPYITHIIAAFSHYGPSVMTEKAKEAGVYTSYRDLTPGAERTEEKKRFDLPLSYFDDPTKYVGLEACSKPKLFFFGKQDVMVTPADVQETFNLAAEPKQLVELDSEHDYRLHPEIIAEVNKAVGEFLS